MLEGVLRRFVRIVVVHRTVVLMVVVLDALVVLQFVRQSCGKQMAVLQREAVQGQADQQQEKEEASHGHTGCRRIIAVLALCIHGA